ncbi:het-c2 protein [Abortiporus biennis]|nr:het-c2 protein [Abortiporus biennis]
MAPYLQTVTSFADVPVSDAGVDTVAFLKAAEGVVGLFDLLGSPAFVFVKTDLQTNIGKVRERYNAFPDKSSTLELLVVNEKGEKKRKATEGLMWLLRGLAFTCKALLISQANATQELAESFTKAYGLTLEKFHGFLTQKAIALAMKACPYRATLNEKLCADPAGGAPVSEAEMNEGLNKWLAALDAIVTRVQTFYTTGGHDKGF